MAMAMAANEDTITVQHPESPTSRFTAVNGKEQPPSVSTSANGNGNGASRRGSDERLNGQPRITPPGQEKLTITTSTREDWVPPATSGDRHSYQPPGPYPDNELSHKRKREGSLDPNSSSANSYHSHALPSSTKQTPTTATTESDEPRQDNLRASAHSDHRDSYGPDVHYRQFIPSVEDPRNHGLRTDQWHQGYSQHQQQHTDDQIREALQGASQNMDAQQRAYMSPDNDDRSNPYGGYGNDRREMSAQSDPKKRKRNFSNRTKTGCMTCRRRKKKCDENRPECNNCVRGGFVCSGYQQRGTWPKQDQKQPPIPLQSKIEYENSPYAPQPSPYASHPGHPRREPLPGYRGQSLRVDPPHGRHIGMDDDQPSASTIPSASVASPENSRLSAISYAQQTPTPVTASSSAYPDRQIKTPYDRQAPFHDLSRQDPRPDLNSDTPQSATSSLPQILHPQMHPDSAHTNPQVAAQLALGLANTARPPTQKEEMLAGRYYFPFDKELVHERERCNAACWRFNSSTNPNSGATPEERARRFRDILQPRDGISPTQSSPVTPMGRVGDNVVVEAPFNCDYGYNISIGQDVAIGRNCTILDTCEVTIGDRCNIGPNVSIYTAELPIEPKRRLGSRGPALGKKITIESDCWIGGGVTILAGVTIGKGSTVGAGSVVTRNVPMYTIAAGVPAYVRRGVPHNEL